MNQAHLHLLLNHVPILGSLFGLLLLATGMVLKNKPVERAGLFALVVVALLTIPAYLTGEGAEDKVEKIVGVSDHFLEEHEELAETALWCMMAVGALALLSLFWSFFGARRHTLIQGLTLLLATVTFGIMVQVGQHGGKIRHSEIRNSTLGWPAGSDAGGDGHEGHDD